MTGLVVKSTGLWYSVLVDGQKVEARLRGRIKLEDKKITNPIAVGDQVEVEPNQQVDGEWVITGIVERSNYVIRRSPRKKGHDHLLASNIDQGVLIVTLKMPRTSLGFIDRFLITLEAFRIPGVIIFNKKDLLNEEELKFCEQLANIYKGAGYEVVITSFLQVAAGVAPTFQGKRSLLCGHSGSGKSTLVNSLVPNANQEIGKVSTFANKGVHTTTFSELFFLEGEGYVIDSPGIKELGLAEIQPEELSHYFPEMRKYLGHCKFNNCLHFEEPGCAVKGAVGTDISEERFESYLGILFEDDTRR